MNGLQGTIHYISLWLMGPIDTRHPKNEAEHVHVGTHINDFPVFSDLGLRKAKA